MIKNCSRPPKRPEVSEVSRTQNQNGSIGGESETKKKEVSEVSRTQTQNGSIGGESETKKKTEVSEVSRKQTKNGISEVCRKLK